MTSARTRTRTRIGLLGMRFNLVLITSIWFPSLPTISYQMILPYNNCTFIAILYSRPLSLLCGCVLFVCSLHAAPPCPAPSSCLFCRLPPSTQAAPLLYPLSSPSSLAPSRTALHYVSHADLRRRDTTRFG